jgi:CubicO group peptidase (beta-lactamase class C family)
MRKITKAIIGLSAVGGTYALYRGGRNMIAEKCISGSEVHGYVKPGFETVRDAFTENFRVRHELGAACSVYFRGERVVDLWGGVRDKATNDPWQEDTMTVVYSATKGLAAMTLALAHSRGWLDYDELVSVYWPEFAQNGKEGITVRQLLAHQAGLFAFDEPVDEAVVRDLDRLAAVMERQRPAWQPGTRHGYHAISLGFYENELLRRVDPEHRTLGQFFQDEIATPLGFEFYIRLPEWISNERLAPMESPSILKRIAGFPLKLTLAGMNPKSNMYRALVANPGSAIVHDEAAVFARNLEVPSGGGVGTARAIARAYGVFANGGNDLGIRRETLDELEASPDPPVNGWYDECMMGDSRFSLGFMKPCDVWPFEYPEAYGHPGAGGAMGFADPVNKIGYGYITNRMGVTLTGDPREIALRNALYSCIPQEGKVMAAAG